MADKEVLLKIGIDSAKAGQDLTDAKIKVEELRKANKELSTDYAKNAAQINQNNAELKNLNQTITAASRVLQEENKTVNGVDGAYQKLNLQYQVAAARAKDLAVAYGENSKEAKDATKTANNLNQQLKDVDKTVGQNQRSVGDYGIAFDGLKDKISMFPTSFSEMKKGLDVVATGFMGVVKQMWLMVANPIGAVIAAVSLVFFSLYSVFKNFKPVVDAVERSLAALGAVFEVVKNVVIGLFTGQKSLSESTKGLGKAMNDAAKDAAALKKAQQELEDSAGGLEVANKKAETQIQKLILQSKNRTLSEKERIALIDQALAVEEKAFLAKKKFSDQEVQNAENAIIVGKDLTAQEIARLKKEGVAYAKQLQEKKGISDEEINILKDALLKREDISQASISLQEKAMNRRDQLEEKAKEEEEKRQAKLEAKREKAAQAEEKRQAKLKLDSEKRVANAEKEANREMQLAEKKMQLAVKALNDELTLTKLKQDEILAGKTISNEQKLLLDTIAIEKERNVKLAAFELEKKESADNVITLANEIARLKKEKSTDEIKAKIQQIEEQKAIEIQKQKEIEAGKLIVTQEAKTQTAQANADFDKVDEAYQQNKQATDLQNKMAAAELEGQSLYDLKVTQLEAQRLAELEAADKSGADKSLINAKYSAMSQDLAKKENDSKLQLYSNFASNIATIFGKNSKVGKMAAVASTTIDTYKGATAAFSSLASIPIVGVPLGIAAAGAAIAGGIANVKSILNTKSGLPGDSGGGGSAPSANAISSVSIPTSITGGIVSRTTEASNTEATTTNAVNNAMKQNPVQPVLVTNDLTVAMNQKVQIKTDNSL